VFTIYPTYFVSLVYINIPLAMVLFSNLLKMCLAVEEVDEDIEAVEEVAQQVYSQNSALLGKGFALASPPTIHQALEGVLPFR
jgi:hypothetical protein